MIDTSSFRRFTNIHDMLLQNGHTNVDDFKRIEAAPKKFQKIIQLEPERYADPLEARGRRIPPAGGGGKILFIYLNNLFILAQEP